MGKCRFEFYFIIRRNIHFINNRCVHLIIAVSCDVLCTLQFTNVLPSGTCSKNPPTNVGDSGSIPGSGSKVPFERRATQVFLPGESLG